MDGRNSTGRRISLLNEDAAPKYSRHYSYSSTSSHYSTTSTTSVSGFGSGSSARLPAYLSRSSSSASTPSLSPQTPQLIRSSSTDSADMQSPSPVTPEFGYIDPIVAQQQQSQAYADPSSAYYPKQAYGAVPLANMPPYPPTAPLQQQQQQQQQHLYPAPPSAEQSSVAQPAQKSKKNQYPCPVAKQYNCGDYFTTSGHAARHAKKHTGKKDALCPDCNKAFTRKDNMEQHRRTHLNGRGSSRSSDDKAKKQLKQTQSKRPKPAPIQAANAMLMDPALPTLPISPTSSFSMTPGTQSLDLFPAEYMQRPIYPDPSQCTLNPGRGFELESPSYGLDTLALAAASGEKRRYAE